MHVDYNALGTWLHGTLKPLCVADPIPLSQYVIALIKRDKSEKELREICIDQLEVFLQDNTPSFVENLFIALKNRSYVSSDTEKHNTLDEQSSITLDPKRDNVDSSRPDRGKKRANPTTPTMLSDLAKQKRKRSTSRKEKSSTRSRSRSRSPINSSRTSASTAASRVSRKTGYHEGGGNEAKSERSEETVLTRPWGAPFAADSRDDPSSYDHRHRERETDSRRGRPNRRRGRSPEAARYNTEPRESTADQTSRNDSYRKRRCRNFDERGFCVFGSQCPFDHGPDPLILTGSPSDHVVRSQLLPKSSVASSSAALHVTETNMSQSMSKAEQPVRTLLQQPGVDSSLSQNGSSIPVLPVYRPTPIDQSGIAASGLNGTIPLNMISFSNPPPALPPLPTTAPPPPLIQPIEKLNWNTGIGLLPYPPNISSTVHRAPSNSRQNLIPISMSRDEPDTRTPTLLSLAAPVAYEPDKPQISIPVTSSTSQPFETTWSPPNNPVSSEPSALYTPSPINERTVGRDTRAPGPFNPSRAMSNSPSSCILYMTRIPWRLNTELKLTEHFAQFGTIVRCVPRYYSMQDSALLEFSSPDETEKAYRSPEPILSNRFIRLSTIPPNKTDYSRRGRQRPYDLRPKPIYERLGRRDLAQENFDWMRSVPNSQQMDTSTINTPGSMTTTAKGRSSRLRLERDGVGGTMDEEDEEEREENDDAGDARGRVARGDETPMDDDFDADRTRSNANRYVLDRAGDLNNKLDYDSRSRFTLNRSMNRATDKTPETAAYLWNQQKALALKEREEQLKRWDKSQEAKQSILMAQKQRVIQLKAQLRAVMSQLEESVVEKTPLGSVSRRQLLVEAKRIQQELESALVAEKSLRSRKLSTSSVESAQVGSTSISAVALQALPESVANERRKLIVEVRVSLKEVENDLTILKNKGEPIVEQRRRILELKRQLVQLETVRASDFSTASAGATDSQTESSGSGFPFRTQTKLDKRPRALFVSGLVQEDVNDFQRALSLNYLHTQQVVKHSEPRTGQPILEITFCTRDFAEAAIRQFHHFHGNRLTMRFESPPLADPVPLEVDRVVENNAVSSVVSSTQAELPSDDQTMMDDADQTMADAAIVSAASYSAHSSPTSTTVPMGRRVDAQLFST